MKQTVRFEGEDGSFMWVEINATEDSDVETVVDPMGEGTKTLTRLEDSLASVRGAAKALMSAVDLMPRKPDEVTLELALSLGVEGGVVVAKGSAKAEASVTMAWKRAEQAG